VTAMVAIATGSTKDITASTASVVIAGTPPHFCLGCHLLSLTCSSFAAVCRFSDRHRLFHRFQNQLRG
jgi:hypothetical protein